MSFFYVPTESEPLPEGLSVITDISQLDTEIKHNVFGQIAALSHEENDHGFMFAVSPETAERSISDPNCGGLIVIKDTEIGPIVAGYAKIMPLTHSDMRLPPVYEFGGLVVNPDFRGHRLSEYIIRELTSEFLAKRAQEDIGEMPLIIATTKNAAAKRAFEKEWAYVGKFRGLPTMMALTCTCRPPFGNGLGTSNRDNGHMCRFRNDDEAMHKEGAIPCQLCIHDLELAQIYDRMILSQYSKDYANPLAQLVLDLNERNHYE